MGRVAEAVLSDLTAKGGPAKTPAKRTAARKAMDALKDDDEPAFEAALKELVQPKE